MTLKNMLSSCLYLKLSNVTYRTFKDFNEAEGHHLAGCMSVRVFAHANMPTDTFPHVCYTCPLTPAYHGNKGIQPCMEFLNHLCTYTL